MTPQELKTRIEAGGQLMIIDIREPYEYEEVNMGATLIPMGDLIPRMNELEPYKEQEIILHCQSGNRSAAACEVLRSMGFEKVAHLEGGIKAFIQL